MCRVCKKCGTSDRFENGRCKLCTREGNRLRSLKWNRLHPETLKVKVAKYHAANPDRRRKACADWKKRNPEYFSAKQAERNALKANATPVWVNSFFIEEAYSLAAMRTKILGFNWHVDHIVPMKSKLVCGLHVENNLQVIPAKHNISKGNRHWPEMP